MKAGDLGKVLTDQIEGYSLDKLAQLTPPIEGNQHGIAFEGCEKSETPAHGGFEGDIKYQTPHQQAIEPLKKRARAKFAGDPIKEALCKQNSKLKRQYHASLSCAGTLNQDGEKITSRYCKQRWCIVCSRIRTGKAINGYYEQLNEYDQLYFGTLTIVNVPAHKLRYGINKMTDNWRKILKEIRKKFKGQNFDGIRKLETTNNVQRNDYHPHFHFLCNDLAIGQYVIKRWLEIYPTCNPDAQDIQPVKPSEKVDVLKELFKYSTKFHNHYIDENGVEVVGISAYHLDKVFVAMRGLRTFQPFGNIKAVSEEIDDLEAEEYNIKKRKTNWSWTDHDWYNIDDGEALTYYEPTYKDVKLKDSIRSEKTIDLNTLKQIEDA